MVHMKEEERDAIQSAVSTMTYYLQGDLEDLAVIGSEEEVSGLESMIQELNQINRRPLTLEAFQDFYLSFRQAAIECREDFNQITKVSSVPDDLESLERAEDKVRKGLEALECVKNRLITEK